MQNVSSNPAFESMHIAASQLLHQSSLAHGLSDRVFIGHWWTLRIYALVTVHREGSASLLPRCTVTACIHRQYGRLSYMLPQLALRR